MERYRSGHNGADSKLCDECIKTEYLYVEEYRSGCNGPDSKSNRSNARPLDKNPHGIRLCEHLMNENFTQMLTLCSQFSKKRFSALAVNYIRRGIEEVITGLTRNQFVGNGTRVRIPPSPPKC